MVWLDFCSFLKSLEFRQCPIVESVGCSNRQHRVRESQMDCIKAESLYSRVFLYGYHRQGRFFLSLVIMEVSCELKYAWRKIDMCGGMISFSLCSIYSPALALQIV